MENELKCLDSLSAIRELIEIKRKKFTVVLLQSLEERKRGLIGVENLKEDEVALFVWEKARYPQAESVWDRPRCLMGSMSMAIRVIFGDDEGKVVDISPILLPPEQEQLGKNEMAYNCPVKARWMMEFSPSSDFISNLEIGDRILEKEILKKYRLCEAWGEEKFNQGVLKDL